MRYKILLVGAGNVGSRYLQGLAKCKNNLDIFVIDVNNKSILKSKQRIHQVKKKNKNNKFFFSNNIDAIPSVLDVAIISTSSDVRLKIIKKLKKNKINNWILEKVLCQNQSDLTQLRKIFEHNKNVWVNIPILHDSLLKSIKKYINRDYPVFMKVIGGAWGLACNTIHFLHLLNSLTGESVIKLDTSKLNKSWHRSKRKGFWEVFGSLKVNFSKNSTLELQSIKNKVKVADKQIITIKNNLIDWNLNNAKKYSKKNINLIFDNNKVLHSKTTPKLISDILNSKKIYLPKLEQSISLHVHLIRSLKAHWNQNMSKKSKYLPVT